MDNNTTMRQPSEDPPQCSATMENFYNHVINNVFDKSVEHFLEEGVDMDILNELRTNWTNRLQKHIKIAKSNASKLSVSKLLVSETKSCDVCISRQEIKHGHVFKPGNSYHGSGGIRLEDSNDVQSEDSQDMYSVVTTPLQICLNAADPPFAITVQVTKEQRMNNRIKSIFTQHLMNLLSDMSVGEATERVQMLLNQELESHSKAEDLALMASTIPPTGFNRVVNLHTINPQYPPVFYPVDLVQQSDVTQVDGADGADLKSSASNHSSDVDDDLDDDLDDDVKNDKFAILWCSDFEEDSEPEPNSSDDITEEEIEDTENLILCQYMHVKRQKNHWKFRFENGIMIIDGVEYVFQRACGECYW